jgi:predicted aspartyl protease
MIIEHRNGLIYTTISISYHGSTKEINNVVIDTGASHTLISQDIVDEIGIRVSLEDEVVSSYGIGGKEHAFIKRVDMLSVGDVTLKACPIDFSTIQYEDINGLLGLDVLMKAGIIIDLKNLKMYVD